MECVEKVKKGTDGCNNKECRYFIDHQKTKNCTFICVEKNGKMSLGQIGEILGTSLANISMIQRNALKKLQKKVNRKDCLE